MKIKMISNNYLRLIGTYLFFSLVFFIIFPIWILLLNFNYSILVFVSCAGSIGGTLYAMRGFYQHIAEDDFDDKWVWWYLFRPLQGLIAGIFSYFLVAGGIVGSLDLNNSRIMIFIAISFLAGYGFTEFANSLNSTLKKISK